MRPRPDLLPLAARRSRARRSLLLAGLVLPALLLSAPSDAQIRTAAAAAPASPASHAAPPAAPAPPPPSGGAGAGQAGAGPGTAGTPQLPPTVTIETVRGQRPKIKLAIPGFHAVNLAGDLTAAGRELEETVRADLAFSGAFEIQGAEAFKQPPLTGDVERDLPGFRSQGHQVVLLGDSH